MRPGGLFRWCNDSPVARPLSFWAGMSVWPSSSWDPMDWGQEMGRARADANVSEEQGFPLFVQTLAAHVHQSSPLGLGPLTLRMLLQAGVGTASGVLCESAHLTSLSTPGWKSLKPSGRGQTRAPEGFYGLGDVPTDWAASNFIVGLRRNPASSENKYIKLLWIHFY